MIGEFPAQKASNAENVSTWWRHHVMNYFALQGFVDKGEEAIDALKREFCEEAMSSEDASGEQKEDMAKKLEKLFKDGTEVGGLVTVQI